MKKTYCTFLLVTFNILLSFNFYSQWTLSTVNNNSGDDLQSVCFADENTAFCTGYSGVIYKSTDAGINWDKLTTTIPVIDMYAIAFFDANTGLVAGDVGKIYKTTDGGISWSSKVSGTAETFYGFTILDATTVFAYGGNGVIKRSTDGGETWSSFNSPSSLVIRQVKFLNSNPSIVFACGDNTGSTNVYKSIDGGTNWSTQSLPVSSDGDPTNLYGLSIFDENTVFVCGGSKRIATTSNGGTAWSNINSSLANYYKACLFDTATEGYVVGGSGKIIKTTNASTFSAETTGVTSILYSIAKNTSGTYLVVGGTGNILRKAGAVTNSAPIAQDDVTTTNFDQATTTTVLANDSDPEGSPLTVNIISQSADGNAVVNGDGSITFTPTIGYSGTTSYTYQVCDNGSPILCDQATVTITVNSGAADADGDGSPTGTDCNDNDPTIYPGAVEVCDGIDNNCNGSIDEGLATITYYQDADLDGFGAGTGMDLCFDPGIGSSTLNTDCDDVSASIHPGATDIPNNGVDEDCNGSDATSATDADGDGVSSTTDCDDSDPTVYPGATEICDFKDNDCNNSIDDGLPSFTYYADADLDGFGAGNGLNLCMDPGAGSSTFNTDCNDASASINPSMTDIPNNGVDEDCSGSDAGTSDPVANDDSGTCIENGLNAFISILTNDSDPMGSITNLTHTVDIDLSTSGVQSTFTATAPSVSWIYNSMFQTLSCDPAQDVEGTVTLIYEICNVSTSLCNQGTVSVLVTPSTAALNELKTFVSLSPNPVATELILKSSEQIQRLKIVSSDGKIVMESEVISSNINVESFTKGWYCIEITLENGIVSRNSFMKL